MYCTSHALHCSTLHGKAACTVLQCTVVFCAMLAHAGFAPTPHATTEFAWGAEPAKVLLLLQDVFSFGIVLYNLAHR